MSLGRTLVDAAVRLLDQRHEGVLAASALAAQRVGGERRRDLARLRTAHPVRDREDRRVDDVDVLVVPALAARVGHSNGAAEGHAATSDSGAPGQRRRRPRQRSRHGLKAASQATPPVTSRT